MSKNLFEFKKNEVRQNMIDKYLKLDEGYGNLRYFGQSEKSMKWSEEINKLNLLWDSLNEHEKYVIRGKITPSDELKEKYFNGLSTIR